MNKRLLGGIGLSCLTIGGIAWAQTSYPPTVTSDELSQAITAATPPPCPAPLSDGLVASAGTQSNCMPRADAQRAAQTQRKEVVTGADGSFSGTWDAAFPSAPVSSWATVSYFDGMVAPYICSIRTTAIGFDGKCWLVSSTTLPGTLTALSGLVVSPIRTSSASITVRVGARL